MVREISKLRAFQLFGVDRRVMYRRSFFLKIFRVLNVKSQPRPAPARLYRHGYGNKVHRTDNRRIGQGDGLSERRAMTHRRHQNATATALFARQQTVQQFRLIAHLPRAPCATEEKRDARQVTG